MARRGVSQNRITCWKDESNHGHFLRVWKFVKLLTMPQVVAESKVIVSCNGPERTAGKSHSGVDPL